MRTSISRTGTPLPLDVFRDQVTAAIAGDGWAVDGNYSVLRDLIWDRADTVVWLDLPRPVVMRQVVARTLRRMATSPDAMEREPGAMA